MPLINEKLHNSRTKINAFFYQQTVNSNLYRFKNFSLPYQAANGWLNDAMRLPIPACIVKVHQ